ncbi:dirigent protein 23-like [Carex rostrata]
MAYFQSCIITGSALYEAKLRLYLHHDYLGTNRNQTTPVVPTEPNDFGQINVIDWSIEEGSDRGSKVVAHAQGMQVQCGKNKQQWYCSFNMVFEDDRFKGSTLGVQGVYEASSPKEWIIVGGTGQFKLAQGTVSATNLSEDANGRILELAFHIFYRTIES